MSGDLSFQCRCGAVKGVAREISPERGTRVVCYCNDCQAFVRRLGREGEYLDEKGGSDIFQIDPRHLQITDGADKLAAVQLTPKGVYRWYTTCCNTPVTNTMNSAAIPVTGTYFRNYDPARRDAAIGPVRGAVFQKFARDGAGDYNALSIPLMMIKVLGRTIVARFTGAYRKNPFFNPETGAPIAEPHLISHEERESLYAGARGEA